MLTLGQKKLIISFSGQFFQKLLRQGGFIFLIFIASDQNEGFYFFSYQGVMRHFLLQ